MNGNIRMPDLNEYYSMVRAETWQQVLGDEMFFYHGDYSATADFAEAQRQALINLLAPAGPGTHVLDAGCGWGSSLTVMQTRGLVPEGLTISSRQAEYCQAKGLPARYADLSAEPLSKNYDLIVSVEVLDHFARRPQIFRHFRDHAPRLSISINCVTDGFPGKRQVYDGTMPMCSTSELRGDLENAGWRITDWRNRRRESLPTLFHWRQRLLAAFGQTPPPGVFNALFDMTEQFLKNPGQWAQSFPLIDVVAE